MISGTNITEIRRRKDLLSHGRGGGRLPRRKFRCAWPWTQWRRGRRGRGREGEEREGNREWCAGPHLRARAARAARGERAPRSPTGARPPRPLRWASAVRRRSSAPPESPVTLGGFASFHSITVLEIISKTLLCRQFKTRNEQELPQNKQVWFNIK